MRRAVTTTPGEIVLDEAPAPAMTAGGVRIGVESVGLCGSDFSAFAGHLPYLRYPQVQGHEASGVVLELAPDYTGALAIGDRVAIEPTVPCGDCRACRTARDNACVRLQVRGVHVAGALADELVVDGDRAHPVGDLDADLAALVEPVAIALHAFERGPVRSGDTVVVLGAGPIGNIACLAATEVGARVIVADRHAFRLARASRLGAVATVDVAGVPADRIPDAIDAAVGDGGADVVVEATGSAAMLRTAFDTVGHGGTVVVLGVSDEDVTVPMLTFTRKELTVVGSRNSRGLFPTAIEFAQRHRAELALLISHVVPLEAVGPTMTAALESPGGVEKVIVRVRGA